MNQQIEIKLDLPKVDIILSDIESSISCSISMDELILISALASHVMNFEHELDLDIKNKTKKLHSKINNFLKELP